MSDEKIASLDKRVTKLESQIPVIKVETVENAKRLIRVEKQIATTKDIVDQVNQATASNSGKIDSVVADTRTLVEFNRTARSLKNMLLKSLFPLLGGIYLVIEIWEWASKAF